MLNILLQRLKPPLTFPKTTRWKDKVPSAASHRADGKSFCGKAEQMRRLKLNQTRNGENLGSFKIDFSYFHSCI